MQHDGPHTHITALATSLNNVCIQMVNPWLLYAALDLSTDLRDDLGETMQTHFEALLRRKYENCTEWFTTNLATLGVQEPLVVIIRSDTGEWQFDQGHHRLAWALYNFFEGMEIPIVFDDTGADDESIMDRLVARANVDAMHSMVPADTELVAEVESALTDQTVRIKMPEAFVPSPRRGRHRAGGKHRALA